MQSLFPAAPVELAEDDLVELYAYPVERPWVRANVVSTLDGAVQGRDGRSISISTPADRRLFALLRSLCDVVVVGAGTARAESYAPVSATPARTRLRARLGLTGVPAVAVVTRSLDLPLDLVDGDQTRAFVITGRDAPADRLAEVKERVEVIVCGDGDVDPVAAMEALVARGFQRILTEGGPSLLQQLLAGGCCDELCLSVSPLLLGGDAYRLLRGQGLEPPVRMDLRHVLHEDGALFCRYVRAGG